MHLSYSSSTYKGKTYKSYAITTSYREGKKVRKRTIWSIGKLTDEQAEQIRMICKVASGKITVLTQLKDIVVKESRAYLDIALVSELWNHWQLDQAFGFDVSDSPLSTPLVAKILTINRCTNPCSHYSIPKWAAKNALAEVLGTDLNRLNDDKIYYELDKIFENRQLKAARRDRQRRATENRVLAELKRLKIKKYFELPVLHSITVPKKLKNGTVKDVKSFRVKIKKKDSVIAAEKLLDGLCVFVTNHRERQGRGLKVRPQSIIRAYRDKTKIEDVFKNVKSFLKIRPFFVNTEKHAKAVYSICNTIERE